MNTQKHYFLTQPHHSAVKFSGHADPTGMSENVKILVLCNLTAV
jgi:hypothetical protein